MITKVVFSKDTVEGSQQKHLSTLPAIEALNYEIEFTDGLNIIVGPNGSGKSTILDAIANQLAATHTGLSQITEGWLRNLTFEEGDGSAVNPIGKPISNITIEHDGQPIAYIDPKRTTGLNSGQLEDEFMGAGLLEFYDGSRESSGEKTNRRIMPFLDVLTGDVPLPDRLTSTLAYEKLNSSWQQRVNGVEAHWLKGSIPKGKQTILIDEIETGLSLINQILLWKKILRSDYVRENFQIILVSHSIQSLHFDDVNYIELKKGYLKTCRGLLAGTIEAEDAAKFAINLQKKLTKPQLEFLQNVDAHDPSEGLFVIKKMNQAIKYLQKVGFIETYTERKSRRDRRRGFDRDSVLICQVKAKGLQYLKLHK